MIDRRQRFAHDRPAWLLYRHSESGKPNSGLAEESLMTGKLPMIATRAAEIVSINPATLEELARFPLTTADEVNAAVARARAAQPAWAALSCRNRARYILKVR